jgi:NADH:ubiquinone oxidoreductase subunit 5 (subunit L)/multisubunit Na+/H+ antiporter MnhA subunit
VKGWLIFAGVFFVGILLIISSVLYEILVGAADEADLPARVLAITGIVVTLGAVYGSAAWRFHKWWKTRDLPERVTQTQAGR